MNGEDQFEKRLQRLPQCQIPPEWRKEILTAASASAIPQQTKLSLRSSVWSAFNSRLSAFLWPHPKAWAGLAAIWVLIMGLNFATREPRQIELTAQQALPSPQMRELLRQQEQLLAELIGPNEPPEADRPKTASHQPRSQRCEDFLNA
jgi:hypothetical protein